MIDLNRINKVHFIGIGGNGISAAAGLLKSRSFIVSGSDAQESEMVNSLRRRGVLVYVPHNPDIIDREIGLVVHSVAVNDDNPERIKAAELGIPQLTYPQLLGLMLHGKEGVGVSGTDGKTTTTALLAKIMIDADRDPSVVLGSQADFLDGNERLGGGSLFIFESDEYRRAFDNYEPQIALITNIGVDHLDYFRDQDDYFQAFRDYLSKLPADGFAIINNDDQRSREAALGSKAQIVTYGIDAAADYRASRIEIEGGSQKFLVTDMTAAETAMSIRLPGRYNIYNALGAIAAARRLGVGWESIARSVSGFSGVSRRFESLGACGAAEVIVDYAHTPPAVRQAVQAAMEFYFGKRLLFVFQPHQYARTKNLFSGFVQALNQGEDLLLVDIFYVVGRENPADFDVSSGKLAEAVTAVGTEAIYGGDLKQSELKIKAISENYDKIIFLGAGDIYELAKKLVK